MEDVVAPPPFGRLLITGATGFVGGRLTRGFAEAGIAVGALVRAGSATAFLDPRATILRHDGATDTLHAAMRAFAPEAVIHAATHFVGVHGPDHVAPLIQANLLFGTQLLDAMARCGVRHMVNFGTSWQHFADDRYNPASLYAATKQAFEDIAAYYAEAEGFTVLTLKLTDTYGPADRRGKLVSALLQAQREGRRLDLSPGEQTLNLLHVDDVLSGSRAALDRIRAVPPHTREAFALRGPETLSLRDLVARIERLGARPVPVAWGARPYRPREVMRPWIGSLLPGWSAAIGLDRGLTELIAAQ
ncbi:NAD-dependent epimerase/dehydratase family protein [Methylobacterium radiotolerans]|uniref:NAD-dependent epimerase/dehydratase family protein n=1 Tax=Methylobacterium radiotolerans TaxID=31998 RepID=UPI001F1C5ADC|nr:NAD(P)-dependent oxidoreductase [Methylobacterium radiotolerans]UIY43299.1 NAD(P)-dependent oxidoreductase [Methylobacterium radiotolerans]